MPLRLSDDQFDALVDNFDDPAARTAIQRLNDDERRYFANRIRARKASALGAPAGERLGTLLTAQRTGDELAATPSALPTTATTPAAYQRKYEAGLAIPRGVKMAPESDYRRLAEEEALREDVDSSVWAKVPGMRRAYEATQRTPTGAPRTVSDVGQALATGGLTPDLMPSRVGRIAANVPGSAVRLAHGMAALPAQVAASSDPVEMLKSQLLPDLVNYTTRAIESGGRAALYGVATSLMPFYRRAQDLASGEQALRTTLRPDDFVDMLAEDPAGAITAIIAPLEARRLPALQRRVATLMERFTPEQRIARPQVTSPPAEFLPTLEQPVGPTRMPAPPPPTPLEAARAALREQIAEGGAPGPRAIQRRETHVPRTTGAGAAAGELAPRPGMEGPRLHALQALVDEAQLLYPNEPRAALKRRAATDRAALLDEIAQARAALGQPDRPINYPQGEFPRAQLDALYRISDRLERYHLDRTRRPVAPAAPPGPATGRPAGYELQRPPRAGAPPRPTGPAAPQEPPPPVASPPSPAATAPPPRTGVPPPPQAAFSPSPSAATPPTPAEAARARLRARRSTTASMLGTEGIYEEVRDAAGRLIARFKGWQPTATRANPNRPPLALYDLAEDLPGHPRGSTVTGRTLAAAGHTWERPRAEATPTPSTTRFTWTPDREAALDLLHSNPIHTRGIAASNATAVEFYLRRLRLLAEQVDREMGTDIVDNVDTASSSLARGDYATATLESQRALSRIHGQRPIFTPESEALLEAERTSDVPLTPPTTPPRRPPTATFFGTQEAYEAAKHHVELLVRRWRGEAKPYTFDIDYRPDIVPYYPASLAAFASLRSDTPKVKVDSIPNLLKRESGRLGIPITQAEIDLVMSTLKDRNLKGTVLIDDVTAQLERLSPGIEVKLLEATKEGEHSRSELEDAVAERDAAREAVTSAADDMRSIIDEHLSQLDPQLTSESAKEAVFELLREGYGDEAGAPTPLEIADALGLIIENRYTAGSHGGNPVVWDNLTREVVHTAPRLSDAYRYAREANMKASHPDSPAMQALDAIQAQAEQVLEAWRSESKAESNVEYIEENLSPVEGEPLYPSYKLPGGKQYREHLVKVESVPAESLPIVEHHFSEPVEGVELSAPGIIMNKGLVNYEGVGEWSAGFVGHHPKSMFRTKEEALQFMRNVMAKNVARALTRTFSGGHWTSVVPENVLAHLRTTVRRVNRADGTTSRALFVEEFQSDWDIEWRRANEVKASVPGKFRVEAMREGNVLIDRPNLSYGQVAELIGDDLAKRVLTQMGRELPEAGVGMERASPRGGVPEHPLRPHWRELTFKEALRTAADEGYDGVAWTTGAQQAERYSLTTQIDALRVTDYGEQHAAAGILPSERVATFTGEQLELGGTHHKRLYDSMMVDLANKWGKRFGTQVELGSVELPNNSAIPPDAHYLPLPKPAIDAILTDGFPLIGFASRSSLDDAAAAAQARLRARARGTSPGGGLEPLLGSLYDLAVIGASRLARGMPFAEWKRSMLTDPDAATTFARLGRADQQRIYDAAQFEHSKAVAHDANLGIADAATALGVAGTDLRHAIASRFNASADAPWVVQTASHAAALIGRLGERIATSLGTSPRFTRLLRSHPDLYHHIETVAASRNISSVMSRMALDDLLSIFADNGKHKLKSATVEQRQRTFARFLNSEQSRAISERNAAEQARFNDLATRYAERARLEAAGEDVPNDLQFTTDDEAFMERFGRTGPGARYEYVPPPPPTVPVLSPLEYATIARDPVMQRAISWWVDNFQPYLEQIAPEAGIEARRAATPITLPDGTTIGGNIYSHLHYFKDASRVQSGAQVYDLSGGGRIIWNYATTRARAARRATGIAPEGFGVSEEMRDILDTTLGDRMGVAHKRALQDYIRVMSQQYEDLPKGASINLGDGVTDTLTDIQLDRTIGPSTLLRESFRIPSAVKSAYDKVVAPRDIAEIGALNTWSNYVTASALLVPAEATMHGLAAIHGALQTPGLGYSGGAPTRALSWATIAGRTAALAHDMWSLQGDAFRADILRYAPALRTLQFTSPGVPLRTLADPAAYWRTFRSDVAGGQTPISAIGHRIPGMEQIRDFVFGFPGYSHGLRGLETRMRVAMGRAMHHIDPTLTDAEVRNLINNQLGTYVARLEPWIVTRFRSVDPFARAGVALTKSGIKSLAFMDPRGRVSPEVAVATLSTAAALILLQRELDPKKRLPWDISGLPAGNLAYFIGDKRYEIPLRYTLNSAYRGMRATGVQAVTDAYLRGEESKERMALAWGAGVTNFALGRLGPPVRLATTAMTGHAPYLTPGSSGELLPIDQPNTLHPLEARFYSLMKTGIPIVGKMGETYIEDAKTHPDSPLGEHLYFLAKTLGFEPTIRPAGYELQVSGAHKRGEERLVSDLAFAAYRELQNVDPAERSTHIRNFLATRVHPDHRAAFLDELMRNVQRMPKRYATTAVEQQAGIPPLPR